MILSAPDVTVASPARIQPVTAESLPPGLWSTAVMIRFGHCDPAGIVFTPRYFEIFNGVIEAWFGEALGIDYYGLVRDRRRGTGYGHAGCEFLAPSRMGDVLDVAVAVERIGRASFSLTLHALRDGREVVRGRFVSVVTDLDTGTAVPIPDDLRAALEAYRAGSHDAGSRPAIGR